MVAALCAAVLAVAFGLSAAAKIADPAAFRVSLPATLGVAPLRARALAPAVVAAEVLVVVAVVAGLWSAPVAVAGFAAAAALLAVFTAAVRSMIRRGVSEPCHCFGAAQEPPGRLDLVRNALLGGAALLGAVAVLAGERPGPVALAAGLVAGAALALLVVRLDAVVWLLYGPVLG